MSSPKETLRHARSRSQLEDVGSFVIGAAVMCVLMLSWACVMQETVRCDRSA